MGHFCFRQAGNYTLLVSVWNPFSSSNATLSVSVVNTAYGVSITGSPVVGPPSAVRTFNITFVDVGPTSCVAVDYGDGSALEVYGLLRFGPKQLYW